MEFGVGKSASGNQMTRAYLIVLLLISITIGLVFKGTTSGKLYFYDQADYMYAGSRGIVNNWLDRPSLSTVEFVRKGLALARDKSRGSEMSAFIRGENDITFYRHYHGPIYAYWLALCKSLGVTSEAGFRGSGLIIHALTSLLIFISFHLVFPEYAPVAAFVAALTFLCNRTGIVAATMITQHGMFGLMTVVVLFPLALYCRTGNKRFWYATAALTGIAFATVESSFLLVITVVAVMAMRHLLEGWRVLAALLARGTLAFLAAIFVVWPTGVLALGGAKGYIYLAYIALVKKTFTPISPVALWTWQLRAYPEEFILPLIALITVTLGSRRLAARNQALPYVVYVWVFICVTMIITAPYSYYHTSMMAALAVVTGIAFAELWRRGTAARLVVSLALLSTFAWMDYRYYGETLQNAEELDQMAQLVAALKASRPAGKLYVPYVLVPTLHYYMPNLSTEGYSETWTPAMLTSAVRSEPASQLICDRQLCQAVGDLLGVKPPDTPVMPAAHDIGTDTLYEFAPIPRTP